MQEMLARLVDVPMARMFILAGIVFLLVAVLGRIEGKIEPGNVGRVGATVVGILLTAGGLAMYFIEGDMIRQGLRAAERASASPAKNGTNKAASAAADPAGKDGPAIKIVAATYGRNCGAKAGNATAQLSHACDGHATCDLRIDVSALEDPAPKCDKDYVAEWKCGAGTTVYTLSMAAGAAQNEPLRLACSRS